MHNESLNERSAHSRALETAPKCLSCDSQTLPFATSSTWDKGGGDIGGDIGGDVGGDIGAGGGGNSEHTHALQFGFNSFTHTHWSLPDSWVQSFCVPGPGPLLRIWEYDLLHPEIGNPLAPEYEVAKFNPRYVAADSQLVSHWEKVEVVVKTFCIPIFEQLDTALVVSKWSPLPSGACLTHRSGSGASAQCASASDSVENSEHENVHGGKGGDNGGDFGGGGEGGYTSQYVEQAIWPMRTAAAQHPPPEQLLP